MKAKIHLEINFPGDGRCFLNYWNHINGDDVIAQVVEGELIQDGEKISIKQFIDQVKEKIKNKS